MEKTLTESIIDELVEKDSDESASAYSAFLHFALMTHSERNASDALKKVGDFMGLTESTVRSYRANHRWEERINLLDAHFYKLEVQKRLEILSESTLKYAEDTKEIQSEAMKAAKKALAVVNKMLENAEIAGTTKTTGWVKAVQKDGSIKEVPTTITVNMKSELRDVAPLLRAAVAVPVQAAGLPTDSISPILAKNADDIENLSDEKLEEKEREILKELQKKRKGGVTDIDIIV